jgi:ribosome-associated heat shock protein Hsp15
MTESRQRIDKWLWHARVVRTRTAAAALVDGGLVRLNGGRISANSQAVKTGDVVTVALDRTVRIMKVTGFADLTGSGQGAARGGARCGQRTADQAGAPCYRSAAGP